MPPPPRQTQPTKTRGQKALLLVRGLLVFVLGVVGLIASVDTMWGPIWPTGLDLEPSPPDFSQPFSSPMVVTNRSVVFPMVDVIFDCRMPKVEDRNGNTFDGAHTWTGKISIVKAGESTTFKCNWPVNDVSSIVSAKETIESRGTIRFLFWRRRIKQSHGPFRWDTTVNPPRWYKGDLLH
jgi:hypothetical protein